MTFDGPRLDLFFDVTLMLGHDHKSYEEFTNTLKVMGAQNVAPDAAALAALAAYLRVVELRLRMNPEVRVIYIKTEDTPLTEDNIQALLDGWNRDGTLRENLDRFAFQTPLLTKRKKK